MMREQCDSLQANPRGVNFVVTVIVSFHPAGFITKNDRAFHVRCFYMEPDEIVTSSIDVRLGVYVNRKSMKARGKGFIRLHGRS